MRRKEFIKKSSILTATGLIYPSISSIPYSNRIIGANNKIRIGAIGLNGMGWADTKALINISGVELVAICDVDQNVIKKRKKEIDQLGLKVKVLKIIGNYWIKKYRRCCFRNTRPLACFDDDKCICCWKTCLL